MNTVAHIELPMIILHVLVAAADIPVCARIKIVNASSAHAAQRLSGRFHTRSLAASAVAPPCRRREGDELLPPLL